MDSFGLFILILALATIVFIVIGINRQPGVSTSPKTTQTAAQAKQKQMADDIKMTKTSRVVDEVSILEELSEHSPNFRQYCELVGNSQSEGGVTAPYSRRQVAYYEIRCYRIDNNGTRDVETLVAHERSFDPFYFTDDSCDTPIYVNLESFGENVILVNSTNHIEGPNSDFAKAIGDQAATQASSSSPYSKTTASGSASYAVSAGLRTRLGSFLDGLRERLPHPDGIVLGPQFAFAGGAELGQEGWSRSHLVAASERGSFSSRTSRAASDAARRAEKASKSAAAQSASAGSRGSSVSRAVAAHGGGAGSSGRFSSGSSSSRPKQGGGQSQSQGQGSNRGVQMSTPGFSIFFGTPGNFGGFSSVPRPTQPRPTIYPHQTYHRPYGGDVLGDMITGMVLSSVLDSMAQSSSTTTTQRPTSTFRGYRLVEDVVPLNSPVYCIGEIYRNGTDVYMGRSLAADYPTSFFATKPEVEVLERLNS